MDFIWFNLFSTVESVGMFVLMLAMFRFKLKEYIYHIVYASILLSLGSYFMRVHFELPEYFTLLYIILSFLFVWLMFRVQVFYAAVMAVTGLITSLILQGLIIFVSINLKLYTMADIAPFTMLAYINQLIVFVISLLISWLLIRKRLGFTFVPFSESIRIKATRDNIIYFVMVVFSVVASAAHLYWALQGFHSFLFVIFLQLVIFMCLIYVAIRREKRDD